MPAFDIDKPVNKYGPGHPFTKLIAFLAAMRAEYHPGFLVHIAMALTFPGMVSSFMWNIRLLVVWLAFFVAHTYGGFVNDIYDYEIDKLYKSHIAHSLDILGWRTTYIITALSGFGVLAAGAAMA